MSTFKEIITRVDESKPNAFSNARKFQWLATLDGKIAADVFLMGIEEIRALPHKYTEDMNREPLVGYPHEELYDYYLEAKIDAANGEYDHYQNSMELYNESYNNFVRWFCSVYRPAQGGGFEMCPDIPAYYITAYGLAVKAGFHGSLEQWLLSLKGEKGDTGKSAYEYALEAGYTGTEEAFRESQLNNGKTAYEYAVEGGYAGTVAEFRAKMAAEYALSGHDHDEDYAAKGHDHKDAYSPKNHNHASVYAQKSHNHDGNYLKVAQGAIGEAMVLKRGLHYGTEGERPEEAAEGQVYWKLTPGAGGTVAAPVVGQAYGAASMSGYSASDAAYAGYSGNTYYGYILKFTTGELTDPTDSLTFTLRLKKGEGDSATLRYGLCTSDGNKEAYVGTKEDAADENRIASGTVTFDALGSNSAAHDFTVPAANLESNTTYYLFLWAAGETGVTVPGFDHTVTVNLADGTMHLSMELYLNGQWVTT